MVTCRFTPDPGDTSVHRLIVDGSDYGPASNEPTRLKLGKGSHDLHAVAGACESNHIIVTVTAP